MRRIFEHKEGRIPGVTKKYGIKTLVHFEEWGTGSGAIHREKRLKKWPRASKITLIRTNNPDWKDLAEDWYPKLMTPAEIETWLVTIAPEKIGSPGSLAKSSRPGDDA